MNPLLLLIVMVGLAQPALAQSESPAVEQLEKRITTLEQKTKQTPPHRVDRLESRVSTLEQRIRQAGDQGLVLMLFGAFCALWAQQTGRNSWLWFFLGAFFSVITVLVLLRKNADDRRLGPRRGPVAT